MEARAPLSYDRMPIATESDLNRQMHKPVQLLPSFADPAQGGKLWRV